MQLDQMLLPIREDLATVETVIRHRCTTSISTITEVVHYIIQNGGKRFRPALTILAARLAGYVGDAAAQVGAAMEMVHTASLLHDDVVDNAPTRRGRPSTNAKWGNQISVLVGDFFWCKACEIIVDLGQHRILRAITDAVVGTTEGEVLELIKSNDISISEEEYLKIIAHKTAKLLACSCHVGAMLGGVSETLEHAVQRYGFDLGMAFQLADDALDYVSDEDRFGKSRGTDLREGRMTLPLIIALQRCDAREQSLIKEALLAQTLRDDQLAEVLQILDRSGGMAYTQEKTLTYVERAKSHLAPFKHSLEKAALFQLADYVTTRDM
ncbi:MAG: polyprenyl synthetase family protein [Deltaproteobacteria bacterium]|nr:polyprenyl synthetase family protein [Deltaproteobacteria bacterium]